MRSAAVQFPMLQQPVPLPLLYPLSWTNLRIVLLQSVRDCLLLHDFRHLPDFLHHLLHPELPPKRRPTRNPADLPIGSNKLRSSRFQCRRKQRSQQARQQQSICLQSLLFWEQASAVRLADSHISVSSHRPGICRYNNFDIRSGCARSACPVQRPMRC